MLLKYILVIVLFAWMSVCNAAELFVATTGNDTTGNGSIDTPYSTLHKALQVAVAYDTITLREGTYEGTVDAYNDACPTKGTQTARIITPNLTIQGYPGENAHISNPWNICSSYAIWVDSPAHHTTLKNLEISGGTGYAIKFEVNYYDSTIGANYSTVDRCKIHDGGTDIIKIPAGVHDITIKNSEIYNSCTNLANGGSTTNCQGIDAVRSHNGLVSGNYIHDIVGVDNPAAYFKGGSRNTVFERNKIEGGSIGIALGGNTGASYMDYVDNPSGYQTIDATVRNNIIIGTSYAGLDIYCSYRAKIYNNTLINVGSLDTGGTVGISFKIDGDQAGLLPSSTDILLQNNLIYRNSGVIGLRNLFYLRAWDGTPYQQAVEDGGLKASNNLYYDPTWNDFHGVDVSIGARGNILYQSWEAWKASALHAAGYGESGSSYADPQISLLTGVPQAGSPVINSGVAVSGLTDDYSGNLRTGGVYIGAIQSFGKQYRNARAIKQE